MTERARNTIVGLSVLGALILFGGLIAMFTSLPQRFQPGYDIHMEFDASGGVSPGDSVYMSGMKIGWVTDVAFTDPDRPTAGVTITARIQGDVYLPGNTQAHMHSGGLMGAAYLSLYPDGPFLTDPQTGEPYKYLPKDKAITVGGISHPSSLIPQEVTDALEGLSELSDKVDALLADARPALQSFARLADNLNALLGDAGAPPPAGTTQPDGGPAAPNGGAAPAAPARDLKTTLARLGEVIDGLAAVVGDPKVQQDLKQSLAALPKALADAQAAMKALEGFSADANAALSTAKQSAQNFDKLAEDGRTLIRKLIGSAEDISRMMTTMNRVMAAVEQGEGTAGKLIGDNQLYNNLVDASRELTKAVAEFRRLLEQWKAKGVGIQLK